MKLNGVFDRIGALILGKHELFDDKGTGRRPIDVLHEVLGSHPLPIVNGFDACHTHPMLTIPLGCTAEIDFDTESIQILDAWLDMPHTP